jgi:hypothetical protein
MQTRNRADYTIAGHELVAEDADLRVADCAAISLSERDLPRIGMFERRGRCPQPSLPP